MALCPAKWRLDSRFIFWGPDRAVGKAFIRRLTANTAKLKMVFR